MTEQSQDPQDPQPSKAAPASFGERMRREREMRGVKLEEIAESTKIGKRNLVALEQERFDQLPGGIFNKGFVRAYAKYLGLDEEQAVNDFLAASANYDQPAALQPPPTSWVKPPVMPSDDAIRRRNRFWVVLAAILLVGGFIAWFYWKSRPRISEDADQPQTTQAAIANNASAQADPPVITTGNRANLPGQPVANSSTTSVPNAAQTPIRKGVFTVKIQAKETSWVNVVSDGEQVMNVVIPAGEERTIRARQELVLKTGNSGGITVVHNGVPIPVSGGERVKTLTFNARGLKR